MASEYAFVLVPFVTEEGHGEYFTVNFASTPLCQEKCLLR